jgi:MFS family permease
LGSLGILAGGWLTDRLAARGHTDATMRVGLLASVAWIVPGIFYPLMPNGWLSWSLMATAYFFVSFPIGAAAAAIQNIMPNPMRGQASALYLFAVNLLGLGLGPSAVAWCTDYLFRDEMMVRYSILIVGVGAHIIAVFAFWLGLKPYRESVERLKRWLAEDEEKA